MLKTLEKIVDAYLIEIILPHKPFHETQHAYRRGRSTETALHAAVHKIERSLHFGEFTLALFFDVEGAFDKARITTIKKELEAKGSPRAVTEWITSLLTERQVTANLNETKAKVSVTGGCPQGSCLSPHLWCLVMDGLLHKLTGEGFYSQAYADDGLVLVTGKFLLTVCERMQVACRIIETWCKEVGLTVNPTKTEVMLFTNRRNLQGYVAPKMFGQALALKKEVKYLGLVFDPKLMWNCHIDKIVKKNTMNFWQLRRAIGKTWGLTPRILLWFYTAVIRPRLQYGSIVWWSKINTKQTSAKLAKIQRLALLGITGVMRSTPSASLEVILGVPPLSSWIKSEAVATYIRLRDSGQWKDKGAVVGHATIAEFAIKEIPLLAAKMVQADDRLRMEKSYQVHIPTRTQWERGEVQFPLHSLVAFTDGSLLDTGQSGAGVYLEGYNIKEALALGSMTTVFQAEVFAILVTATRPEILEGPEGKIIICSDSLAALKSLSATRVNSALVQECRAALETIAKRKEVMLYWVPGHSGILGNEEADKLARQGAESLFIGPEPALGLTKGYIKSLLRDWKDRKLKEYWRNSTGCRQSKMMILSPERAKSEWLLSLGRTSLRLIVGLLTGHNTLRRHLALMGVENSPLCPKCEEGDETSFHFIASCEAYGPTRFHRFGACELKEEDLKSIKWSDLLLFARETRRFEDPDPIS